MAGIFGIFARFWIWMNTLFTRDQLGNHSSGPTNASKTLLLMQAQDITTDGANFISKNVELYTFLSMRHGAPNLILNFHFMSGSNAFISKKNINFLLERAFYSLDSGKGHRAVVDKSFLIYTIWNSNWTAALTHPRLMDVNETYGSIYFDDTGKNPRVMEGPEDPRVLYDPGMDKMYLNFNIMTPNDERQMFSQSIQVSENNGTFGYVKVERLSQFGHPNGFRAKTEKNWVPILIQGQIHYVYSLTPLRILKCDLDNEIDRKSGKHLPRDEKNDVTAYKKVCKVQFNGIPVDSGAQTSALRCGTNWIEYSKGIYFSFARTRVMHKKCPAKAIYRPNLIVLQFSVDPVDGAYSNPRITYVSEPISRFDDQIFALYEKKGLGSGNNCDDRAVLTPGSISNWNSSQDVTDVIMSVNDDMTVLLQVKGFGEIVRQALDSKISKSSASSKPPKNTWGKQAEKQLNQFVIKSFSKAKKASKSG